MNCRKRSLIVGALVLSLGLVGLALHYAALVAGIAVAYKVKTVCSTVFVSRRDPHAAVADLEVDDLAILRHIGLSIRTVSTILQNHYVLAVHNVRRSADFYVRMLGFRIVAEPAGWIFVARDGCMIMLGECPDDARLSELGCHNYFAYLRVADADQDYSHLKAKGAEILSDIENKPFGMREFSLRTADGHRITIGQSLPQSTRAHERSAGA